MILPIFALPHIPSQCQSHVSAKNPSSKAAVLSFLCLDICFLIIPYKKPFIPGGLIWSISVVRESLTALI